MFLLPRLFLNTIASRRERGHINVICVSDTTGELTGGCFVLLKTPTPSFSLLHPLHWPMSKFYENTLTATCFLITHCIWRMQICQRNSGSLMILGYLFHHVFLYGVIQLARPPDRKSQGPSVAASSLPPFLVPGIAHTPLLLRPWAVHSLKKN